MAVAAFDYCLWSARYPQLVASVPQGLAKALFAEAGLYLDNTDASPIGDVMQRLVLLNMLVAHLALLQTGPAAQAGLVGRVTNASEGSVSVGVALDAPGSAGWFAQTPPGLSFWQATAPFRTAMYVPGAQPYLGVGLIGRSAQLGYDPSGFGQYGW